MDRVAVFVDAGYLFAQGSVTLTGSKQPRARLSLDEKNAINELLNVARAATGGLSVLRIYWYDGVSLGKGLSAEQALLAHTDNVKLRLGFINSSGQQKGVDSLIVTDLIELARNGSICDAVVLSGDEDIRVGVQVAQSFGVRVHLLGIAPSRGSQSKQLLQEVDTTTEWDAGTIARFLSLRSAPPIVAQNSVTVSHSTHVSETVAIKRVVGEAAVAGGEGSVSQFDTVVDALVASLSAADIAGVDTYSRTQRGVPPEFDGKLLARSRSLIGRDLNREEIRNIRTAFTKKALARAITPKAG